MSEMTSDLRESKNVFTEDTCITFKRFQQVSKQRGARKTIDFREAEILHFTVSAQFPEETLYPCKKTSLQVFKNHLFYFQNNTEIIWFLVLMNMLTVNYLFRKRLCRIVTKILPRD